MQWCQLTLQALGHADPPAGNEFITLDRHNIIPEWYRTFTDRGRDFVSTGGKLALAERPNDEGALWRPSQRLLDEWETLVDTFGILERGEQ